MNSQNQNSQNQNANIPPQRVSSYSQYLPAILQSDPFISRWLLAFERCLSDLSPGEPGDPLPEQLGFEMLLDRIHTYFQAVPSPQEARVTPSEFLPWLASWVALSLREDWPDDLKRRFISQMVPLYRLRGTKAGIKRLLELYTGEEVTIYELADPPHYFQVEMTLSVNPSDRERLRRQQQIARAILDQEKPAHTFYYLQVLTPSLQIRNDPVDPDNPEGPPVGIWVGVNTLLGTSQLTG
ncbi:phage tail protein I [Trichothermofontia sp.]